MFKQVYQNFGGVATSIFQNSFVLSRLYKCTISELSISIHIRELAARGYSTENPSVIVFQKYKKMYEDELHEFLENPSNKAMYDKLRLEVQYLKNHLNRAPAKPLTAYNWLHLLKTSKASQRRSYLEFLWKIEKKCENKEKKKELQRRLRLESPIPHDESPYGLAKCSMFHRIRDSTMNQFYNSRLINAMLYEPSVVFDLGYEHFMTPFEQQNCAKQLLFAFSQNRIHENPFNLYFCNVNRNGPIMHQLHKFIPQILDKEFPLNICSESYLDIFDKEQLVYLTPHTNNIMLNFDPRLVYVIGGMVDKMHPKPFSFQKARKEGLKMMRFPLAEKLHWGTGSTKNLPLNHVLPILLDLRHTDDWTEALKHVPQRKLKDARLKMMQKQISYREKQIAHFVPPD